MPTESSSSAPSPDILPTPQIKCSICGSGALSSSTPRIHDGVVLLSDPIERICGGCVRSSGRAADSKDLVLEADKADDVGLGITGLEDDDCMDVSRGLLTVHRSGARNDDDGSLPLGIPLGVGQIGGDPDVQMRMPFHSQSLPSQPARPWTTASASSVPTVEEAFNPPGPSGSNATTKAEREEDRLPNPLLDITNTRIPGTGRGALYPGSLFRGTQTSGRSAYEVEVRLLDVNFPGSSLSGYLSISQLTDAHPHLTTFFTGEIIGPTHGFITGARYGATEHDDMRHWGRFEQFRRPSTRADMVRPELLFRDPLPGRCKGEVRGKERDFVFLRIKERFLVPDHRVKDISGASFAGFYFAMVDLAPTVTKHAEPPSTPAPPIAAKIPTSPTLHTAPRRLSSSGDGRSPSRPDLMRRRRESSASRFESTPTRGEATIRGYYFHSLNQEPFQELFLTHIPSRSASTFEMR